MIVKTFQYLGFLFASNGKHEAHIAMATNRAKGIMGEVWGIGERRFKNNFRLRMSMFDALIRSGMLYGCEVFGWTAW